MHVAARRNRSVDGCRWSVADRFGTGYRRPSTHYLLLPTRYWWTLRVGMAPREALSLGLPGMDFCSFDKPFGRPFDGPFDRLRVNSGATQGKLRGN